MVVVEKEGETGPWQDFQQHPCDNMVNIPHFVPAFDAAEGLQDLIDTQTDEKKKGKRLPPVQ